MVSHSRSADFVNRDMTTTKKQDNSKFSAEERAAMQARASEVRDERPGEGQGGSRGQACLDAIAEMPEQDRALGHAGCTSSSTEAAPGLAPKTWYGMPAYATDGKVVCYFKAASKFKTRYAQFGFEAEAAPRRRHHVADGVRDHGWSTGPRRRARRLRIERCWSMKAAQVGPGEPTPPRRRSADLQARLPELVAGLTDGLCSASPHRAPAAQPLVERSSACVGRPGRESEPHDRPAREAEFSRCSSNCPPTPCRPCSAATTSSPT